MVMMAYILIAISSCFRIDGKIQKKEGKNPMCKLETAKDVLEFIKKQNVEMVDLRFMDFPGLWQHFSVPPREIDEDVFENGIGFDASSMRGWKAMGTISLIP